VWNHIGREGGRCKRGTYLLKNLVRSDTKPYLDAFFLNQRGHKDHIWLA
jgi:hypothetical protein